MSVAARPADSLRPDSDEFSGDQPVALAVSVLEDFRTFVGEQRAGWDADPETFREVSARAVSLPGLLASMGLAESGRERSAAWRVQLDIYEHLRARSVESAETEQLASALIATFAEELRAGLQSLWATLLATHARCDGPTFSVLRAHFHAAVASGSLPDWSDVYGVRLSGSGRCPELAEAALEDLILLAGLSDVLESTMIWNGIAMHWPWSPRIGELMRHAARDPESAFGVVEALRWYASQGELALDRFLGADPELLEALIRGESGALASAATVEMLANVGGPWGLVALDAALADPHLTAGGRAQILDFLGSPENALPWSYFEAFVNSEDPEVVAASFRSIGSKAGENDEAFAWLQAQVRDGRDGAGVEAGLQALAGLAGAGRPETAEFLLNEVLPTAQGPMKARSVALYAIQSDADPNVLGPLTDFQIEADPEVRAAALQGHLVSSRDMESTAALLERMTDDPDPTLAFAARMATEAILTRKKGDEASVARWARFDTFGYRARKALVGGEVNAHLRGMASQEALEQARFRAQLMQSTPFGQQAQKDLYLLEFLSEMLDR